MHSTYFETEAIPWLKNFMRNLLLKTKRWKDRALSFTRIKSTEIFTHVQVTKLSWKLSYILNWVLCDAPNHEVGMHSNTPSSNESDIPEQALKAEEMYMKKYSKGPFSSFLPSFFLPALREAPSDLLTEEDN